MRKPTADPASVQMSDVLCDFCGREWADEIAMIEGHQGSCLCARCLTVAYAAVVVHGEDTAPAEFQCPMCLERSADRAALGRGGEPGWCSPVRQEAVICRRCIEMAAAALDKDKAFDWSPPSR